MKDQLITVLRSGETRRIHFTFAGSASNTITVDNSSFSRVAAALDAGTITVAEGGVASGWALYDARHNAFNVGEGEHWSRAFNALLVHESVHASFDLTSSVLPWLDNEVAAYIAQGYYLRNSGFPRARLDDLGQPYLGLLIVDSIIQTGSVNDQLVQELQGTLLSSPDYHSYIRGTFRGDG